MLGVRIVKPVLDIESKHKRKGDHQGKRKWDENVIRTYWQEIETEIEREMLIKKIRYGLTYQAHQLLGEGVLVYRWWTAS